MIRQAAQARVLGPGAWPGQPAARVEVQAGWARCGQAQCGLEPGKAQGDCPLGPVHWLLIWRGTVWLIGSGTIDCSVVGFGACFGHGTGSRRQVADSG